MIRKLRFIYCAELLIAALIAILYEAGLIAEGTLAGNDLRTYWMSIVGIALTIVLVPVAMRLMKFKRVNNAVVQDEAAYYHWSIVRFALLGLPLLYNTLCYYLLGCETTCGYLALMVVVAFLFVWPSMDKMEYEREGGMNND